ncbi:MAG TPA: hypothetical protein VF454_07825 [Gemmatimonadales bacterium]
MPRLLPLLGLSALIACGDGGGGGGPTDDRCAGIAQVHAWRIQLVSAFHDTGSADTFSVRLHTVLDLDDTTGAGTSPSADVRRWVTGPPSGSVAVHDTAISTSKHDTLAADVSSLAPASASYGLPPNAATLEVDLASCTASVDVWLSGYMHLIHNSFPSALQDSELVANVRLLIAGTAFDSMEVADGWNVPATKIRAGLPSGPFSGLPEYRTGGFIGPYYTVPGPVLFDSATVAWSAVPVGTPGHAPMLQGGRIGGP